MDVSVVVPAHDEEGNLRRLVDRLRETRTLEGFDHSLEIVSQTVGGTER